MADHSEVSNVRVGPRKLFVYAEWLAGIWLDAKLSTLDDWNPGPDFTDEDRDFIIAHVRSIARKLRGDR